MKGSLASVAIFVSFTTVVALGDVEDDGVAV